MQCCRLPKYTARLAWLDGPQNNRFRKPYDFIGLGLFGRCRLVPILYNAAGDEKLRWIVACLTYLFTTCCAFFDTCPVLCPIPRSTLLTTKHQRGLEPTNLSLAGLTNEQRCTRCRAQIAVPKPMPRYDKYSEFAGQVLLIVRYLTCV